MTRKRQPVAEIAAEDYRIVKHTHDVKLAVGLMRAALIEANGCCVVPDCVGSWTKVDCWPVPLGGMVCLHKHDVGKPKKVWVRIQGAIPGSFAEAEGWRFAYHEYSTPGRGAFPAVVFR